jgi:FolB domain-containing protein
MSKINIVDLEVFYCVGVTEEERAAPQRLLISVEMNADFTSAAVSDRLEKTINYHTVAQRLLKKFSLPQARYVSVTLTRGRGQF